jgi:hypothetical protein
MPRIVAIEAPAGYGKTTYLASLPGAWVGLLPGEGAPEEVLRLVYRALLGQAPPPGPPAKLMRALLGKLPSSEFHLRVDDVHHLTPEGADFLLGLLQHPGARLYLAGRDLLPFRLLPRLVASGEAEVWGPEELLARTGFTPRPLEEEVERRLAAMPPEEREALVSLAGLPFWRHKDLEARGLSYHHLVAVHGLPIQRAKGGTYWPHDVLKEALLARADESVLLQNAQAIEDLHPEQAARLYALARRPEEVVRLALPRAKAWLEESRWPEVVAWLAPLPEESLGPLRGLLALAYLERGESAKALRLAGGDSLSLVTRALHAFRSEKAAQAKDLATQAIAQATCPLERILATRVALAARHALGEKVDDEVAALLSESAPFPAQHLAVRSFQLYISPNYTLAREGLELSLQAGYPHRAVAFLQAMIRALFREKGSAEEVLAASERVLAEGHRGTRFVLPYAHVERAHVFAFLDQLHSTVDELERGIEEALLWPLWNVWRSAMELLVEVRLAQGLLTEAKALLDALEARAQEVGFEPPKLHTALWHLFSGRPDLARPLLEEVAKEPGESAILASVVLGRPVAEEARAKVAPSLRLLRLSPWSGPVLSLRDRALYLPGHEPIRLTEVETLVLLGLLEGPATPGELAERVYGDEGRAHAVHTALHRLRSKNAPVRTYGRRYVLEGCRLDLALSLEAARSIPHLLPLDLPSLLPGDEPIYASWRARLLAQAKAVALEWAQRGKPIPGAHLLDPEDPEYLDALGHGAALEVLKEGVAWQ